MKTGHLLWLLPVMLFGCMTAQISPKDAGSPPHAPDYLPRDEAESTLTVTRDGTAAANVVVLMEAVAVKENGPKETVKRFGEVYTFQPAFFAVRRDEPTLIRFWNLQPDDEHDFMVIDLENKVLMKMTFPPLQETKLVFTFHKEGLYQFICPMHRPEMNGQILVLSPESNKRAV